MECAGLVTPNAPYVGICEYVTSGKLRRFSGSFSSVTVPKASQVESSAGNGAFDVTSVLRLSCVGEYSLMITKTYSDPL